MPCRCPLGNRGAVCFYCRGIGIGSGILAASSPYTSIPLATPYLRCAVGSGHRLFVEGRRGTSYPVWSRINMGSGATAFKCVSVSFPTDIVDPVIRLSDDRVQAWIKIHSDEIDLRVKSDEVLSAINASTEGVQIIAARLAGGSGYVNLGSEAADAHQRLENELISLINVSPEAISIRSSKIILGGPVLGSESIYSDDFTVDSEGWKMRGIGSMEIYFGDFLRIKTTGGYTPRYMEFDAGISFNTGFRWVDGWGGSVLAEMAYSDTLGAAYGYAAGSHQWSLGAFLPGIRGDAGRDYPFDFWNMDVMDFYNINAVKLRSDVLQVGKSTGKVGFFAVDGSTRRACTGSVTTDQLGRVVKRLVQALDAYNLIDNQVSGA